MITRIYRVRIRAALRAEFEPLFRTVAKASVEGRRGCTRVTVAGPVAHSPDEYAMLTEWNSEEALQEFVGEDWSAAHIPEGMERFVDECWVHHYTHL